MKIYVASSWRNEHQQQVVGMLRTLGHEVYDFRNPPHGRGGFSWSDIDENWQNWSTDDYRNALNNQVAIDGYFSDYNAMEWAECCVMVLPCGRSANTEAGWFKGKGKLVYVFQPTRQEPELMYKMHDGIISDYAELLIKFTTKNGTTGDQEVEGRSGYAEGTQKEKTDSKDR